MAQPIIRYEAGQTPYPFEAMTDTGDNTTFEASFAPWSNVSGSEPVVAPYGLLTGGAITPTATNNQVSVAALTASMAGVATADAQGVVSVDTGTLLATRGTEVSPFRITSFTVDSDGDLVAIAGTVGSAFSEDRGAAGGPPYIPVGSIELGQARLSSDTAGVVLSSEIYAVPGQHTETAGYPVFEVDYATGSVTFATALPTIHTGDLPKDVYVRGATPLFAPIPRTSDWVPAESTYSITSTDTYDGPVGSASSSLGQATFTAVLSDGIIDSIVQQKGKTLWFEFRPDRDKMLPKQLTQGVLGVSRTFPAGGGSFTASCTITPNVESLDVRS